MNPVTDITNPACEYIQHESGIHEIIFYEATRRAVDEYMTYNEQIVVNANPDETVTILLDVTRSGLPPMAYLMGQVRQHMKKYPWRLSTRVAIVYENSRLLGLLRSSTQLVTTQQDTLNYFKADQRETAMKWLLD